MEIIIRPDKETATKLAADLIANSVKKTPSLTLGLATGRTMEELYDKLAAMDLDFAACKSFNLDEYIGLKPDDNNSYRYYMNKHLFEKININICNTYLPDGIAEDTAEACRKYEKLIKENGGVDIQLLGIGRSGHIGFNEPLSSLSSRTREKALTPVTIAQNSPLFADPDDMPKRAITMGVGTILEARRIILLVTGKEKADILAKAVEGPITSMISATALQLHPACTVIVDEDAGEKLQEKEYYHWIFENEPEWESYK